MSILSPDVLLFLNKSTSIWKIIDNAYTNSYLLDEIKKYNIRKRLHPCRINFQPILRKSLNSTFIEWQLISNSGYILPSYDILTPWILNERNDIDFEAETSITIQILSDIIISDIPERMLLISKAGRSIENLFSRYRFANKLIIRNEIFTKESIDDFILHALVKVNIEQLEYLSFISLYSIYTFVKNYDINEYNIFHGKPNLKEFSIHIGYLEMYNINLTGNDDFWRFIDSITKHNIQLKITFVQSDKSISLAITILKYCKKKNINVFLELQSSKFLFFNYIKDCIKRKDDIFIKKLSSFTFIINQLEDLKFIKYILNEMDNLEEIIILFNKSVYPNIKQTTKNNEIFKKFYNVLFDFKAEVKNIKRFTLKYHDNYFPTFFETFTFQEKLYDMFIISILSIIPNSIINVKFINMPYLKEEYFDFLYKSIPNMKKIAFKKCRYIPDDVLLNFRNLKHVLLDENIGIIIPSWIDIVIYKNFSDFMCGDYFIPQMKKNESHFFKIMKNSKFKNTFWLDDNFTPDTVIFMKDVMKWRDATELLNF
uniref:F-box domain-containing protein n=1 Tax=Strongyloides venezuelensis TaxID=75913 RepID=A0A0K0F2X3_STRVS